MTGTFSDYQASKFLDELQATDVWLALMSDDPMAALDPLTVELSGGSYARSAVSWSRPGPRLLRVANVATFAGLTAGQTVRHVSGFDAATNGNLLFDTELAEAQTTVGGQPLVIPSLSYYISIPA